MRKWKSLLDFQARGASVFCTAISPPLRYAFPHLFRTQPAIGELVDPFQLALDPLGQLKGIKLFAEVFELRHAFLIGLRTRPHPLQRCWWPLIRVPVSQHGIVEDTDKMQRVDSRAHATELLYGDAAYLQESAQEQWPALDWYILQVRTRKFVVKGVPKRSQ